MNKEKIVINNVEITQNDVDNCMFALHDLIEATFPLFENFSQLRIGNSGRLEFSRDDIEIFIDAFQTAQTIRLELSLTDKEN
jgi:hypothetical protein